MNIYDVVLEKYQTEIFELAYVLITNHNNESGFGKSIRKTAHRNRFVQNMKIYFIKEGKSDAEAIAYALSYMQEVLYPKLY